MPHRPENPKHAAPMAPTPPRIVWVAFLVRIAYMTIAHTYRFREYAFGHHFAFGFEMGRIGQALATGYGFADPFIGHTGPTAWVGPLYPLLIGAVFKLFGVYTLKSAWILLAINCALCALIVPAVWEIASRCFNQPRRPVVGVDLGAPPRSHAIRRPLGLGDDTHHPALLLGHRAGAQNAQHRRRP